MNGWLLARIAGICVGIVTLLQIATNEGLVTYVPLFQAWLKWLSNILEFGFLTELIGPFLHWGIEWVRSFGISVPDLQDEWRPAWVLSILLFTATARYSSTWWAWPAGAASALAVATVAGLTGQFSSALFAVGLAAFLVSAVYGGGVDAVVIFFMAFLSAFIVADAFALAFGTAAVFSYVAAAAILMFWGVGENLHTSWRAVSASANFNMGLDILFAMGGAFSLAVWFANPPIW